MRKVPNWVQRWMRSASRLVSIGCLAALLLVLSGENYRTRVKAGFRENFPAGNLYVLSIGINAYPRDSGFPVLRFALADAQGVASAFSTKEVQMRLLVSKSQRYMTRPRPWQACGLLWNA